MTAVPRVLTIQDMSSIGRCALTVMIPIISAMRCPGSTFGYSRFEQSLGVPPL